MKYLISILLLFFHIISFAQPKEESISLLTSTGTISGSIFIPEGKTSFPVLLVIAGSGPTDRYGNSPMGVKANSYKMLAEALCLQNVGVLLFDKRGVSKSASAGKKENDLRFENYVDDVVQWVELLKKDKRLQGIFIAGHSEGSLIGMLAAEKIKVQGYISIAGPARSIAEIITQQYTQQLPKTGRIVDSLFSRLQKAQPLDTVPPYLMPIFRPSLLPYIKSWMKYIPCNEIKKLTVPTLIIQGGTDIQVAPEEAALLKKCKANAAILLLDSMNHVLKNAPLGRTQNIATYSNTALPLSDGLTNAITIFIKENNK